MFPPGESGYRKGASASHFDEKRAYPALCRVPDYAEYCRVGWFPVRWGVGATDAPI